MAYEHTVQITGDLYRGENIIGRVSVVVIITTPRPVSDRFVCNAAGLKATAAFAKMVAESPSLQRGASGDEVYVRDYDCEVLSVFQVDRGRDPRGGDE